MQNLSEISLETENSNSVSGGGEQWSALSGQEVWTALSGQGQGTLQVTLELSRHDG